MEANDPVKTLVEQLKRLSTMYGPEHVEFAAKSAARILMAQGPEMRDTLREALKDIIDVDALDYEPPPVYPGTNGPANSNLPTEDVMLASIRQAMPGVQTQAQFNLVLAAFDAVKVTLNASFLGDKRAAAAAREVLLKALDSADRVTELSVKLSAVPEAATSKEAEVYKTRPLQFDEYDTMKSLLIELQGISEGPRLVEWYNTNREKIDRVVSPKLRNELLDTIRAKKNSFSAS